MQIAVKLSGLYSSTVGGGSGRRAAAGPTATHEDPGSVCAEVQDYFQTATTSSYGQMVTITC